MSDIKPDESTNGENESPPIGKSWRNLYAFVIIQTAVLVLFFYLFTRFFE